jgi:hypothetical protein
LWSVALSGSLPSLVTTVVGVSAPADATESEIKALGESMAACAHVVWRDASATPVPKDTVEYEGCDAYRERALGSRPDFVLMRLPSGKLAINMKEGG